MKHSVYTLWVALFAALSLSQPSLAQAGETMKPGSIEYKIAVQRACQAAIWAMPAISTWDIANAIMRDLDGEIGDIVYMTQPMESRHGFLTANDVTPYAIAALTTKDGPLVVEVPPASEKTLFSFGTFVDGWMRPVSDVGPAGSDKGEGAKYLFLPPGYEGDVPDGYLVFPLETWSVNFAFRPVSRNGGTIAEAAAYSKTLKTYLLSEAANPPPTRFIDAYPKVWNTLPLYDITHFQDLWNVVQNNPVLERDKSMMGLLAEIGIEKGKPFKPDAEMSAALNDGVQCAYEYLQERFTTPGGAFVPYFGDDNQWQAFNISKEQAAIGFPFEADDRVLIEERAISYFYLTYLPVTLGPTTFYLVALRDANGEQLNGTDAYRMNVPADTPAKDFWSVIAYSMKTKGFIENVDRVGLATSDMKNMKVNEDGSVDIYFAPKPPKDLKANWIPTAGEDFFVIFRLYGPEAPVLDKSWTLGNVEKVQ